MQMVQSALSRRIKSWGKSPAALGSLWMVAAVLGLLLFSAQAEHRAVWWSGEVCHGGSKWSRKLWAAGSTSLVNLHTLWCSHFHLISNSRLGSSLSLLPFSHSILLHKSWAILVDPLGSTEKKGKWTRTTYLFFFPINFSEPPKTPVNLANILIIGKTNELRNWILCLILCSFYISPSISFIHLPFSSAKLLTIKRNYLPSGFALILFVFIAV